MERYDIAIIGTGPAGLEAAITAKIRNKKIILFGNKNLSLKVEKAHTIQNYLGLPDIGGEELKAAYEAHLKAMDIEITEDKINAVYAMGEYFALQGNGTNYEAQTVILATGVSTAKVYPGEEQFRQRRQLLCHLRCTFIQRKNGSDYRFFSEGGSGSRLYGGDGRQSLLYSNV